MRALAKDVPYDIHRIFDFKTVGMPSNNRITFGCGAINSIGAEAAGMAKGKALLIIDAVLEKLGVLEKVKDNLTSAGLEVAVFTEVEAEPHIETPEKIYNQYADAGISIIIGVGGGSVMDMSKLAAISIANKTEPIKYANGEVLPESRDIPLILAPTTSGTGSEVSPVFVVSVGKDKKFLYNSYLYSDVSIIDPELTVTMPPLVTAATGLDALSHAIEAVINKKANPVCDFLALGGIELAGAYLRRACADGEDLEARYHMALSATLSMMAMGLTGAIWPHSVSYIVAMYKPTAHGLGCALGLPYTMAYNAPVSTPQLARIAEALGEQTGHYSEIDAANLAAQSVYCLMADIGLPTSLEEYGGIKESDLEEAAKLMLERYPRPGNPRPMGEKEAIQFWYNMWSGELA